MRDSDYIASVWLKVRHSNPSEFAGKQLIEVQDRCEKDKLLSNALTTAFDLGFKVALDRIHYLQQRVKEDEINGK